MLAVGNTGLIFWQGCATGCKSSDDHGRCCCYYLVPVSLIPPLQAGPMPKSALMFEEPPTAKARDVYDDDNNNFTKLFVSPWGARMAELSCDVTAI
nr:hypothetical protein BaRGS_023183 [Batillaria attramentaria]